MTWLLPLGLATVILLASLQCWRPAGRWPTRLREEALLAGAWVGVVALLPFCWPLAVLLALALWRERDAFNPAVRVWATAGLLWVAVLLLPPETRWLIPAAYVAAALGQCGLLGWQAAKWAGRVGYHDLRNALHGSMGTRFFCGLLIAQAMPLAPLWALPVLALGLVVSSSATALLAALVGLLLTYPAQALPIGLGALVAGAGVMAMRKGWRRVFALSAFGDGIRERGILLRLTWARFRRLPWRTKLLGGGHDAFSTQSRFWAHGPLNRVHLHAVNDGAQALLEVGILGLACLLALVGLALFGHGRLGDPLTGTVAALLVGSLLEFPFHVAHMAVPSLILVALLAVA